MIRRTADIQKQERARLRQVGFWRSKFEPDLPHPREFVANDGSEDETTKVIAYLDSSYETPYVYAGVSWCRCGCLPGEADLGSRDLTDGTWIYPEGIAHYLREHGVKPHEEFLNHIRKLNYTVPIPPAYPLRKVAVKSFTPTGDSWEDPEAYLYVSAYVYSGVLTFYRKRGCWPVTLRELQGVTRHWASLAEMGSLDRISLTETTEGKLQISIALPRQTEPFIFEAEPPSKEAP